MKNSLDEKSLDGRSPDGRSPEGREGSGALSRRGARAYQMALEAVFSIPIAIGLGYWADSAWGTGPILLLVGVVVGFGAYTLGRLKGETL